MRKFVLLLIVAVAATTFGSTDDAYASAPIEATVSATSDCCENFQMKDGYPKVTETHRIVRSSYEFTEYLDVTVEGVTTSFTCDGHTPDEQVVVDFQKREFQVKNFEVWTCESAGGEAGSLSLRNVGFGAFGQGWSGNYTILQGTGYFEGASGRFTSGTGGVGGEILLRS